MSQTMSREIAERIAQAVLAVPYEKQRLMATDAFLQWLRAQAVPLLPITPGRLPTFPLEATTVRHFWAIGLVRPVAVLESELSSDVTVPGRFVPTDLSLRGEAVFVDLGKPVTPESPFLLPSQQRNQPGRGLLWHPFQLWLFSNLANRLQFAASVETVLWGREHMHRLVDTFMDGLMERLVAFSSNEQPKFLPLLALLVSVEPLVREMVYPEHFFPRPTARPLSWPTGDAASRCREEGAQLLQATSITVEEAVKWHRRLTNDAQDADPLQEFRIVMRHAGRQHRERLTGRALYAHNLYDAAEVLRRYLEYYHSQWLTEEDEVVVGQFLDQSEVKRKLYGSPRMADFDRFAFRQLMRRYGLDPQARTTWIIEGDTEEGFIRRLAELWRIDLENAGIDLENLGGKDQIDDKHDHLIRLLNRLGREEVFVAVALDWDGGGRHIESLRRHARKHRLSGGGSVFKPDFEEANFSDDELAAIATSILTEQGFQETITAQMLRQEMAGEPDSKPYAIGTAVERLVERAGAEFAKDTGWGTRLAEWAFAHRYPDDKHAVQYDDGLTKDKLRPIIAIFRYLLTGQQSHYGVTRRNYEVKVEGPSVHPLGLVRKEPRG